MDEKDSKQRSIEQFSNVGNAYVVSKTHAEGEDLERLVAIAQPQQTWIVLDVATGGGHTALTFSGHVNKVVATDITPNMLASAEKFLCRDKGVKNVVFELADAENLPYAEGIYDLVTCRIAPHHFPDCGKFVRECFRVLKAGGLFLLQDQVLPEDDIAGKRIDDFEQLRDSSHNRAYSESAWRDMFETAGFCVEHSECLTKRHDFDSWARRMVDSDKLVQQLIDMVKNAPEEMVNWLEPLPDVASFHLPGSSFVNHHLLIAGRKPS